MVLNTNSADINQVLIHFKKHLSTMQNELVNLTIPEAKIESITFQENDINHALTYNDFNVFKVPTPKSSPSSTGKISCFIHSKF